MTLSHARRARIVLSLCGAGLAAACSSDATTAPGEEFELTPEAVANWTAGSSDVRGRILPHLTRRQAALQLESHLAALTTAIAARNETEIRARIAAGWQILQGYDDLEDGPELSAIARVLDAATLLIGDALPPSSL